MIDGTPNHPGNEQEDKADNPQVRSRFRFEAEINGGLEHPNIVPVYGLGTDANGRPFYAIRLIRDSRRYSSVSIPAVYRLDVDG